MVDFADLLAMVAEVSPKLRVRYSTSHPKDMTDKVLEVMARYPNICKYVHLPVQSGSSEVLKKMNRGYTREWYLERIASIRHHMPTCAISTDIIAFFVSFELMSLPTYILASSRDLPWNDPVHARLAATEGLAGVAVAASQVDLEDLPPRVRARDGRLC